MRIRFLSVIFVLLILSNAAPAQQVIAVKAGMINYSEGRVYRDDEALRQAEKEFVTLKNGQVVWTSTGMVELLLSPNAYLRVGEYSSLLMEQDLLSDTRVVLDRGSAMIEVVQAAQGNIIHVRCGTTTIEIARRGLYRLDAGLGELRVYGGTAEVANGKKKISVARGKRVRLDDTLTASRFDRNSFDPLHLWSAQRSFYLFTANSKCGMEIRNWVSTKSGEMFSSNFRMRFKWECRPRHRFFSDWTG